MIKSVLGQHHPTGYLGILDDPEVDGFAVFPEHDYQDSSSPILFIKSMNWNKLGGFFKREARPTEKETLTARLIDRPIRPLFVDGFKNEVLVMCTVLSHDLVNDPDIVAMIAASAALTISGAPFMGPIAGARVGFEDGEYVLNPQVDDMQDLRNNPDQRLDLVVAGTKDAVMMVESEAYELSEEEMLGAVTFAHEQLQPVIDLIIALAEDSAKEPFDFQPPDYSDP